MGAAVSARKPASQVLREAKALISTPDRWTQGNDGTVRDFGGNIVARCVDRALFAGEEKFNSHRSHSGARNIFRRANAIDSPVDWNDAPGRTHAEVMAAFDKAIALAEAEEAA